MLSTFFQQPSGIYLTEQEIVLVQLKRLNRVPTLQKIIKEPLPQGAVVQGVIQDEATVIAALKKIKAQVKSSACVVGLPVRKCYSTVAHFPVGMKDEVLQNAIINQASTYLPVPLSELKYQTAVVRGIRENSASVFISGIEKQVFDTFTKVLAAAGWKKCQFVLENLALIKAIPIKSGSLPNLMFVHNFDHSFLLSSVAKGQVFDGIFSHDLNSDFTNSFNSYLQQIGVRPSHVIVSGSRDSVKEINSDSLGTPLPKFVQAEFKVKTGGDVQSNFDLIVPIGLALSYSMFAKKNGFQLLTLLN